MSVTNRISSEAEVKKHLSWHERVCARDEVPGCVTFDFFKSDKCVRTETYLININGQSQLASADIRNATAPRYKIIL